MRKSIRNFKEDPAPEWNSTDGLPKWRQSPIDLSKMYIVHEKFPCLYLNGHLTDVSNAKITNLGYTVQVVFSERDPVCMMGGPLGDNRYKLMDMQFRWGATDARGAEHSIDGTWFTMEAQATHWNLKYDGPESCYEQPDGFAILSILFQAQGCPKMRRNPNFARLTDCLPQIECYGSTTDLPDDGLKWMNEICGEPGYYSYQGSFTTPPYKECVQWIIMPKPVMISASQVDCFRNIRNRQRDRVLQNFRDKQFVAPDRKVFFATCD